MEKGILYHIRRGVFLFVKRLFDIICAIVGIIFLIPLTIFIKIAYLLNGDFHSIFYSQKRVGKNGKVFNIYKFRTMVPNAEAELEKLLEKPKYKKEWEETQKLDNDPRITKIGKILRKTSIDETPQFFNVLIGDISLIGPRPLVPGELKSHKGKPEIYYKVKPGITGYWAAYVRSDTDYDERLKLEYFYIEHQSLKLDIKVFFRTFAVVFKKTGAK